MVGFNDNSGNRLRDLLNMDEFLENQAGTLSRQLNAASAKIQDSSMYPEFKELYAKFINSNLQRLQEPLNSTTVTMAAETMLFLQGMLKEHENSMINTVSGLENRRAFDGALNEAIHHIQRDPEKRIHYAILFCDGDEFKSVNDTLGHNGGDQAIFELGDKLKQTAREDEDVYHWGGDEFAIILWDAKAHSDKEADEGFQLAHERYVKAFELNTMTYDDKTIPLSMSLGYHMIQKSDFEGISSPEAMKDKLKALGDAALYRAKEDRPERQARIWNHINESQMAAAPTLDN